MSKKREQIKKEVNIDANIEPLLEYMLQKANTDLSSISNSFVRVWINQNFDLLTEADKRRFGLL
jgi:hypothetical protein